MYSAFLPPIPPSSTAPPLSSSAPTFEEAILARIARLAARLEARLEAQEQRLAMANTTPRPKPEPDPLFGKPLTSWDLPRPRVAPEICSNRSDWNPSVPGAFNPPPHQPAYLESYGGRGGYYNNYESQAWSYNNYESQAWSYNAYEPDRYNHLLQPVQYEPPPPAQYYSVAEPPQQQHYYPPPPSYTPMSDVDATLETDVNDAEIRVDARGDEIAAEPPFEEIGEEESPPTVEPKLEVTDADAGYEQHSELQTELNEGGDELNPARKEADAEKGKDGLSPDYVTVVCSTSACGGLSDSNLALQLHKNVLQAKRMEKSNVGKYYFNIMKDGYGIEPMLPHYGCMVDLFGRAGMLDEAKLMVETMPMKANAMIWGCLMGACEKYGNVTLSDEVYRRLIISGIYALEEVYKDLLNLHLEDRVILKGGGVDTIILF